ncbi:tetratricopeptide repeat protein [Fluviicola taffensis]|uniref:Protein serine/threonine phosphatase n=1 Tax=Fluviicola taffensis (strain DSM 16823 / NCIMB 13979 / RW262) TaxID=755732 RepID=F2IC53_FLUTR|nr:tetratricopeptide repeat protein [Fluviicola taffensis]AEA43279.1 protein serine/threonine phosphatase [Fluviicola taffensis DSM 16823]
MKNTFLCLIILLSFNIQAQNHTIDSLQNVLEKNKEDTSKVSTLAQLSKEFLFTANYSNALDCAKNGYKLSVKLKYAKGQAMSLLNIGNVNLYQGDFPKAITYYERSLKISSRIGDKELMAKALNNVGAIYNHQGDISKALKYYNRSLKINKQIDDKLGIARCLINLGSIYTFQSNIPKALECYHQSLSILEKTNEQQLIATCLTNLGITYDNQGDKQKALDYYNRGMKTLEKVGDKVGVARTLNNIGVLYHGSKERKKALYYYLRSLSLEEEIGDKQLIANSLTNIGNIYTEQNDYSKALDYYTKALKQDEEIGDKKLIVNTLYRIGNVYYLLGDLTKATDYAERSMAIAEEIGYPVDIQFAAELLSKIYEKQGKGIQALEAYHLYIKMRDSITTTENRQAATEMKFKYEYEKKVAADSVQVIEEKKIVASKFKEEQRMRYTLYGGLALVTLFGGFMFNRFRVTTRQKQIIEVKEKETQEQNELISHQNKKVEHQNILLEEKQKEILDSISYAKRLQDAILPPKSVIDEAFSQNFILYKPKDIVAGDFYWSETVNNRFYIAAADSTGHGVPGAMVSVVCSNALNRAVKEFGLTETGQILDKTRELVVETFAKNNDEVKDGMDISLLCINKENGKISWTGANNPLWYIHSGELTEIKPNKQPIGKTENPTPFTTHQLDFIPNTTYYLFTDGMADQFGGEKGKKLKNKPFQEFLLQIDSLSLSKQAERIDEKFENWKADLEQVDDVCIIGIRV